MGAPAADAASMSVTWTAPTTNADGSRLSDLAGYRVYLGTSTPQCPGSSFFEVASPEPDPGSGEQVSAYVTSLSAGTTYLVRISAVDTSGNESACSSPASGTARVDFSVTPAASTTFGSVTTGTTVDRTFTIQNTGPVSRSVSATVGAPFSVVSGGSFSLASGASRTVTVRFAPTAAGSFASSLNVAVDADTISRGVSGAATGTGSGAPAPPPPPPPDPNPAAPASPTNPNVVLMSTDSSAAIFNVSWNAVSGATAYWYGAAYGDGSSRQQGNITGTLALQMRVPYHSSGASVVGYICVRSINAAGVQSTDQACNGYTVPARPSGTGSSPSGPPSPVAGSLSPAGASAGSAGLTLVVNGSGFVASSVVRWNGASRTTTFVSSTQLRASITAADLTTVRSVPVSVFTPAPGGGTSGSLTFAVTPAVSTAPVAGSLSPSGTPAGSGAFTLTVNGSGFVAASVVRWNGANRTTTFVGTTQLRASISAADVASARSVSVSVFTPAPGGGTSASLGFTVTAASTNPAPGATSLSPASTNAGSSAFTLTVNGSGFDGSSVVRWNGANRTTTFVSSTQLRASISAADVASARSVSVSVFTPAPGGGTSASLGFTVTAAPGGGAGAPSGPGAPLPTLVNADGSGVTFDIAWSAGSRATSYRYRAVFSDGTALRQGTVTTPYMSLQMPYHASGQAIGALICVSSVNAAGQSAEVCSPLPVPARY